MSESKTTEKLKIENNIKSLRDIAVETIREAIVSGHFLPKDHLKERDLAKEMGISTTPIKEAFRILSQEGLVQTIPRKGTYVSEMVNSSIEEILMLKSYLEGMCARLAATKISDLEIETIEKQLEVMDVLKSRGGGGGNINELVEQNEKFHMAIRKAAKSPLLFQTLMNVVNLDNAFRKRALNINLEIEKGFSEHQAIFNAIKQRKPIEAEEKMKQHIMRTAKQVLKATKQDR